MQAAVSFHNLRHPAERAEARINAFLTHLAVKEKCPQPGRQGRQEPRGRPIGGSRRCILRKPYITPS